MEVHLCYPRDAWVVLSLLLLLLKSRMASICNGDVDPLYQVHSPPVQHLTLEQPGNITCCVSAVWTLSGNEKLLWEKENKTQPYIMRRLLKGGNSSCQLEAVIAFQKVELADAGDYQCVFVYKGAKKPLCKSTKLFVKGVRHSFKQQFQCHSIEYSNSTINLVFIPFANVSHMDSVAISLCLSTRENVFCRSPLAKWRDRPCSYHDNQSVVCPFNDDEQRNVIGRMHSYKLIGRSQFAEVTLMYDDFRSLNLASLLKQCARVSNMFLIPPSVEAYKSSAIISWQMQPLLLTLLAIDVKIFNKELASNTILVGKVNSCPKGRLCSYTFKHLQPCTSYQYEMKMLIGSTERWRASYVTKTRAPLPPLSVTALYKQGVVVANWKPPSDADVDVTTYRVKLLVGSRLMAALVTQNESTFWRTNQSHKMCTIQVAAANRCTWSVPLSQSFQCSVEGNGSVGNRKLVLWLSLIGFLVLLLVALVALGVFLRRKHLQRRMRNNPRPIPFQIDDKSYELVMNYKVKRPETST